VFAELRAGAQAALLEMAAPRAGLARPGNPRPFRRKARQAHRASERRQRRAGRRAERAAVIVNAMTARPEAMSRHTCAWRHHGIDVAPGTR
jgi:hypothetical protein